MPSIDKLHLIKETYGGKKTTRKTPGNNTALPPADLDEVIEAWPNLPDCIKAAIKALI